MPDCAMDFETLQNRARDVRASYERREVERYGRPWSTEEMALGFVGDVGDLAKLVQAKNGVRDVDDVEEQLSHELSDCLWSVIVLADRFGIDLPAAFVKTMDELERRLS